MKTVILPGKQVEDLSGLYLDLVKEKFEIENVASDFSGTHVFLKDEEDKDPKPIIERWLDKPALPRTKAAMENRKKETMIAVAAAEAEREKRDKDREARLKNLLLVGKSDKPTFWGRIFKVFKA